MTRQSGERSSSGSYQLHNDSGSYVTVYRQEWNVFKELFVLAPGATSDQYESGHEIYILYTGSGEASPVAWNPDFSFTIRYHVAGYAHAGQVNVSSFG